MGIGKGGRPVIYLFDRIVDLEKIGECYEIRGKKISSRT